MHGVALHSHALRKDAESVRWQEKEPPSIVVAVPRVGGLGTKFVSGQWGTEALKPVGNLFQPGASDRWLGT